MSSKNGVSLALHRITVKHLYPLYVLAYGVEDAMKIARNRATDDGAWWDAGDIKKAEEVKSAGFLIDREVLLGWAKALLDAEKTDELKAAMEEEIGDAASVAD
jgi:hypothetical protein